MNSLETQLNAALRLRLSRTKTVTLLACVLGLFTLGDATTIIAIGGFTAIATWIYYSEEVEKLERIIYMEKNDG